METVQIQCGSCNKLMAISTAHLGGQVRCPHCQAVVQAPPRTPAAVSAPTEMLLPRIEAREADSIFAPPEPTDDLFDAGPPPRSLLEKPIETEPVVSAPSVNHAVTFEAPPPVSQEVTEAEPAPPPETHEGVEAEPKPHADLAALQRPRPTVGTGYLSLLMLIFLVPYSVMMTLFVVYLWYQLAHQENPLRMLPDPAAKKDGARTVWRIDPKQPLSDNQKVRLGSNITIGALQVTPEKVQRDPFGDLELRLNVKNLSTNQAFSPMHPDFLQPIKGKTTIAQPYTFLHSRAFVPLYGGRVEFARLGEEGKTNEGDLQPGQQETVLVIAPHNDAVVKKIVESNENLTWRVQLRRGLVRVDGRDVSATAVIGVQFNAREIVILPAAG